MSARSFDRKPPPRKKSPGWRPGPKFNDYQTLGLDRITSATLCQLPRLPLRQRQPGLVFTKPRARRSSHE
jgi:hypothetical protein